MSRFSKRRVVAVGILVLLLAAGWGAYSLRHSVFPKRLRVVHRGFLYRSGQIKAHLIESTLKRLNIHIIVDLQGPNPSSDADRNAELQAVQKLGIEYVSFPLEGDGTGLIDYYSKALSILHRAKQEGKRVLVHCAAGSERTGALIGFYQLLFEKRLPADVWSEIQQSGHKPRRNPRLRLYMNRSLPILAKQLYEQGLLPQIPDPLPLLPDDPTPPS